MIGFGEAVKLFFTRYVDFQGRSSRAEYWWPSLLHFGVILVLFIVALAMGGFREPPAPASFIPLGVLVLYFLGVIIPSFALQVRRLHDIGQTGWIVLGLAIFGAVPLVGLLVFIVQIIIGCLPGTKGNNKYGADPYDNPGLTFD